MTAHRVAVIEDEDIIRSALKRLLTRNGFEVEEAASIDQAKALQLDSFDLIISDLRLPGGEGTDLIRLAGQTPVLIMTSYASMRSAVESMKKGAAEYIAKPFDHEEMLKTVKRLIRQQPVSRKPVVEPAQGEQGETLNESPLGQLVGNCQPMQRLYKRLRKVAPADITVLVQGESGTGKELVAKAIHELSPRSGADIISVNCAAIPESLIEAELFGYEKGAFTGANTTRTGLVEAAEGGTLFLDEIGELPLEAQARLLRVLQEREVRRVGSVAARQVDIRLVAATHRNLRQLVDEGRFREDLYYRLQVIEISLPPLRDRDRDVLEIADHLLKKHCQRLGEDNIQFNEQAKAMMLSYRWPGNVRELENAIQRALILAEDGVIGPDLLGIDQSKNPQADISPSNGPLAEEKDLSLSDYFTQFVIAHQHEMSETELAKRLGISRKCLWERRNRYGIPRPKKKAQ